VQRLRGRQTEDAAGVGRRLAIASEELLAARDTSTSWSTTMWWTRWPTWPPSWTGKPRGAPPVNLDVVIDNLRRDLAGQ
jgi:hypothetical protein